MSQFVFSDDKPHCRLGSIGYPRGTNFDSRGSNEMTPNSPMDQAKNSLLLRSSETCDFKVASFKSNGNAKGSK